MGKESVFNDQLRKIVKLLHTPPVGRLQNNTYTRIELPKTKDFLDWLNGSLPALATFNLKFWTNGSDEFQIYRNDRKAMLYTKDDNDWMLEWKAGDYGI